MILIGHQDLHFEVGEIQGHTRMHLHKSKGVQPRGGEVALHRGDVRAVAHPGGVTAYGIDRAKLGEVADKVIHPHKLGGSIGGKEGAHIAVMVAVRVRHKPRLDVDGICHAGGVTVCSRVELGERGVKDPLVIVGGYVVAAVHDHKATVLQL